MNLTNKSKGVEHRFFDRALPVIKHSYQSILLLRLHTAEVKRLLHIRDYEYQCGLLHRMHQIPFQYILAILWSSVCFLICCKSVNVRWSCGLVASTY